MDDYDNHRLKQIKAAGEILAQLIEELADDLYGDDVKAFGEEVRCIAGNILDAAGVHSPKWGDQLNITATNTMVKL